MGLFGKGNHQPAAPTLLQPPSVTSGIGNATYGNGGYNFSTPFDSQNMQNFNDTSALYNQLVKSAQNPDAAIQQATNTYRAAAVPAFNQQHDIDTGNVIAGLGNKYQSTFGQLTADQQANQESLARAQLENTIYNAGQSQYNTMLGRIQPIGQSLSSIENQSLAPYQTLGQLLGTAGQQTGNYNNTLASLYGTQAGMANNQNSAMAAILAQLAQAGGTIGGQIVGGPIGGVIGNQLANSFFSNGQQGVGGQVGP